VVTVYEAVNARVEEGLIFLFLGRAHQSSTSHLLPNNRLQRDESWDVVLRLTDYLSKDLNDRIENRCEVPSNKSKCDRSNFVHSSCLTLISDKRSKLVSISVC
jgi:hypothetical protein